MNFGLGNRFGKLGASSRASSGGGSPPAGPSLDFSQASNSQYLPLFISNTDDPFQSVDRDLMGLNWKAKGLLP